MNVRRKQLKEITIMIRHTDFWTFVDGFRILVYSVLK